MVEALADPPREFDSPLTVADTAVGTSGQQPGVVVMRHKIIFIEGYCLFQVRTRSPIRTVQRQHRSPLEVQF